MFDKIGRFSTRFRYPIIAVWVLLVVGVVLLAPSLSDVATSDQSGFLPDDAPSIVAAKIAADYFPDQLSESQAVLVIQNGGKSMHDDAAQAYLTELTTWIESNLGDRVGQVLSPADPTLADRLISEDGQVAMIFVGLHGSTEDTLTMQALDAMQERLDAAPDDLEGYVTGSVAIVDDYKSSALESADRTIIITIALVVAILLIIYRSPVSPLVPLGTIGVAYLVSRGLVAWLAQYGWTVSSITDVFMVVLLFGAGTDYCLFLVSRFREFLADGMTGPQGARLTVDRVGETISSSAGTVIVGMLAMSFAEMKLFASTGPSMALSVVVTLLAGLTLTPALLAVLGRRAFWPGGAKHAEGARFWGRLAHWITARPWVPLALALVILVPLAIYGQGQKRNFDMLSDLPEEVPSRAGFILLSEHFGAGEMQPVDIIITEIPDPRTPAGLAYVHEATQRLLAVEGVSDVRSLTLPAGQSSPELADLLRVEGQLQLVLDMFAGLGGTGGAIPELGDLDLEGTAAGLDTMAAYLEELAGAFPELAQDEDYVAAVAALDRLAGAMDMGQQLLVSYQLNEAAAGIGQARALLASGDVAALGEMAGASGQMAFLGQYMAGLAEEYPAVVDLEGYDQVLAALSGLETVSEQLGQLFLVSNQLATIAQEMEAMGQALASNPMSLMPREGEPSAGDQMAALVAYLEELGTAYPTLADTEEYATAMALVTEMEAALSSLDISQGQELIAQFQEVLPSLSEAFEGLAATAAATMPQATFMPQAALPIGGGEDGPLAQVDAVLAELETALGTLGAAVEMSLPEASYLPEGIAVGEMEPAVEALLADTAALQEALSNLADRFAEREDGFFVPLALAEGFAGEEMAQLIETYASTTGEAARLQVVLSNEPFSLEAMNTVARLRDEVGHASQGYVSGGTATYLDMQDVMDRDMWRTMGLVLAGIMVVLVLLLRSLVAPIYMIATILLSYGATLGITRLVFDGIFHEGLTWFVPFLIFVVLVALGMDYNIFLMGRVKEEVAGNGTRAGIERAVQHTGGIITSAGIIMAGTFAAMMSSSLLGLVQLAFAVAVGMLLDTFIIRTTLVPALATLLGRWNWWPGKGPQKAA